MGWFIHYPAPHYKEKGAHIVTSAGIYSIPRTNFKTLSPVPGLYFQTAPLKHLKKFIFVCFFPCCRNRAELTLGISYQLPAD